MLTRLSTMMAPILDPFGTQGRFRASSSEGLPWLKKPSRPRMAGGPREQGRCPLGILGTLDPQVSMRDKTINDAK